MGLPPLPASLKAVQHYLKTAIEHEKRDPIVSYYCRLHAMQKGMTIDKSSPESRQFLLALMDELEATKKGDENDAIHNEMVGQAHVENYALKLFLYADNEDRAARFGKNVVKSFYTSWLLFDVLTQFGELSEEIESNRKYAKWKAAYIHNCLKNGETPHAGPLDEEQTEGAIGGEEPSSFGAVPGSSYTPSQPTLPSPGGNPYPHVPPTTPAEPPTAAPRPRPVVAPTYNQPQQPQYQPPAASGSVQLSPDDYQRAMKLCKYASSALQYQDSNEAIKNLTKALNLLQSGKE